MARNSISSLPDALEDDIEVECDMCAEIIPQSQTRTAQEVCLCIDCLLELAINEPQ